MRSFDRLVDFLRAESFFNVATCMADLPGNTDPLLHPRSHGEAFMSLLTDTEHRAVTRDFLNHDPRRLAQLLSDE